MICETSRLIVRRWRPDEAARVLDIYSRWEVSRWLGASPRAMESIDEARDRIERWAALSEADQDRFGAWAIEVRDAGVVAGTVLFKLLPNSDGSPASDVEVGWHLHPDSQGQGYATEAARTVVARGFDSGVAEVFAVTHPDNTRSQAVCLRLGMTPLGRRDRWYGVETEAFRLDARR